ncbi:MAG: cytochrome c peroxidase [Flavobacterium sp.]|jgi:cytochrome c peroxidase
MGLKYSIVFISIFLLSACGGGGGSSDPVDAQAPISAPVTVAPVPAPSVPTTPDPVTQDPATAGPVTPDVPIDNQADPLDLQLASIMTRDNLTGDASTDRNLPNIHSDIAILGKFLFFSTHLGGVEDSACVSCHHPVLGAGDNLSLPVGVSAVDALNTPDLQLLGLGRHFQTAGGLPIVPRNAPSVFNVGLWDEGLFWDSRVSSLGNEQNANGTQSRIATPDSTSFDQIDQTIAIGTSLAAAQARFPVSSAAEMRDDFESEMDNQSLRAILAERFVGVGEWEDLFEQSFGDRNITFDRIAEALGEYERSMNFVESPWKRYVEGDVTALSDQQKDGAVLFFTPVEDGGAGCSRCHSGDRFTDAEHHIVGFPQLTDDIGREAIIDEAGDRYHFRTPSLLNVSATAPYGHAGLYQTLEEVVRHYDNPNRQVDDLFGEQNNQPFVNPNADFCQLPQIQRIIMTSERACADLYPDAFQNSQLALTRLVSNQARSPLGDRPNINGNERAQIVAFLEALTDPCVEDRACLDPWIVDADDLGVFPDNSAIIAHDEQKLDL